MCDGGHGYVRKGSKVTEEVRMLRRYAESTKLATWTRTPVYPTCNPCRFWNSGNSLVQRLRRYAESMERCTESMEICGSYRDLGGGAVMRSKELY